MRGSGGVLYPVILVTCVLGAGLLCPTGTRASRVGLGLDGGDVAAALGVTLVALSWPTFAFIDGYYLIEDRPLPHGAAALQVLVPGIGSLIWAGAIGLERAEGWGIGALGVAFAGYGFYALLDDADAPRGPPEWEHDSGMRLSARPTKGGMLGRAAWSF